jgi:glycine cleavage system H protein
MSGGGALYPENLKYTAEHEWINPDAAEARVRVGITNYAQEQLGDVVYVQLPGVDDTVTAGEPCGEIESTKSVSDLFAPLSGKVVARNDELDAAPEKINSDPYGDGWIFEMIPADAAAVDALLSADDYRGQVESG